MLWQPALHDFFALPEHGMGERIFVISDIQASVDFLQGVQVVSFQGASEWALDYLLSVKRSGCPAKPNSVSVWNLPYWRTVRPS